jgi:hypothetical protein
MLKWKIKPISRSKPPSLVTHTLDYMYVTNLINALPGNSSVNMVKHVTIEESVFSVDPTDAPIDWLDRNHVICVYYRSMSVPRRYKSDRIYSTLATTSRIYKRQTRPLVREGAPQKQDYNCQRVINIWSWAPDRARHQDLLIDWPSVAMWLWLWLWLNFDFKAVSSYEWVVAAEAPNSKPP